MSTRLAVAPSQHSFKRRKLNHSSVIAVHDSNESHDYSSDDSETSEDDENGQNLTAARLTNGSRHGQSKSSHAKSEAAPGQIPPPSGLTKPSVLTLQIQELARKVRLGDEKASKRARPLIENVVEIVKKTRSRPPASFAEAEKLARKTLGVAVPWTKRPHTDVKYTFEFIAPTKVKVRNSIFIQNSSSLEISVEMPDQVFQPKDYLNHRAFNKRSFYLACLASSLRDGLGHAAKLSFAYKDDNDLLPVLSIKEKADGDHEKTFIELNVCFASSVGPISKLSPLQNCVRSAETANGDHGQELQPTPFYNSTLRTFSSTQELDDVTEAVTAKCEAFETCCELGKTWLSQRGFGSGESAGGFGPGEWAIMCALFLTAGGHRDHALFSDRYSPLQLFKAMLQVLSTKDFTDPLIIRGTSSEIPRTDHPTILDAQTGINIMYKMTPWSYQKLRQCASLSMSEVNSKLQSKFDATFLVHTSETLLQNDEVYSVDLSELKYGSSNSRRKLMLQLYKVLQKGLGDRVSHIDLQTKRCETWMIKKAAPKRGQDVITITLLIRPDTATRLIDHGPPAEDQTEASQFREFWKAKAELRRFKDGRINESLVWNAESSVTEQIIRYLLPLHCGLSTESIKTINRSIEHQQLPSTSAIPSADAFRAVSSKYQQLSSILHQLEGLPLPIRSVSPASATLCSTAFNQRLEKYFAEPIDIVVQFDSSSRWPDSLPAIQRTKIAFLVKLSDLVTKDDNNLSTRVGLEDTATSTKGYYNNVFLDIIYPSIALSLAPMVFRIRIHHDRELHLLQTQLADKTLHGSLRDELQLAVQAHKRNFRAMPSHVTAMRNLTTHFTALSTTTCLLKRWISAHHLSNHIPGPVLDVLATHVFIDPAPWSAPGSPTTAFLRILHFLSRWDWATQPLIVDLSLAQDMSAAQCSELDTRFQAWRKLDPAMNAVPWFVGTSLDSTGTLWTQSNRPPRVIAARISALARASIDLLKARGLAMSDADWHSLFTSPLADFDFVVHLKPALVRGASSSSSSSSSSSAVVAAGSSKTAVKKRKYKNLELQEAMDANDIGHDVVDLYLQDLEAAFGTAAIFFYGGFGSGSTVIAGLWRPSIAGVKEWRVRLGFSSVPVASEETRTMSDDNGEEEQGAGAKCVANKAGMLAEMAMLGEGLVEKITEKQAE